MNLIILAAGQGKRLYPLTKDTPKSLLDLGDGTTLLDRQLENAIASHTLHKVYVITGYLSEQLEHKLKNYREQADIEVLYNPYYDVSNNLLSLWCAHYLMLEEDFLVSNGDNIYKAHVYDQVLAGDHDGIQLTIDYKSHYDNDDMKVRLDDQRHVLQVSKKIEPAEAQAESVGLVMVRGSSMRSRFHDKLLQMVKQSENRDAFWLEIFNSLAADGQKVTTCEINHDDWGEVDFHPDIEAMRKAVFKRIF
jgi:choline kinase